MIIFRLGLLCFHCAVLLQLSVCAPRNESVKPAVTAGKHLHTSAGGQTPGNVTAMDKHHPDDNSVEYEDEYPRVAFSTKPKGSSVTTIKGQRKGRDRNKNLCLRKKYRNYCVHGICQYLAEINHTSCVCEAGYSGERCHLFILPVGKEPEGNSHTTALVVIAVVLSLMCLTIIGILLALRDTNQWLVEHAGYHRETSCPC